MEDDDKHMILQDQLSRNEPILRRITGGPGNSSPVCEVCLQPWPGRAVFEGKIRGLAAHQRTLFMLYMHEPADVILHFHALPIMLHPVGESLRVPRGNVAQIPKDLSNAGR